MLTGLLLLLKKYVLSSTFNDIRLNTVTLSIIIKSPPTMWWWRPIVFAESAADATCFCSHSKTPTRIISKYLQYAYWPWGICLVNFFLRFSVSSTKSKMAAKILWRSLELEPLYGFVSCLI